MKYNNNNNNNNNERRKTGKIEISPRIYEMAKVIIEQGSEEVKEKISEK